MNIVKDWSVYPNFSKHEFTCKHTGKVEMDKLMLDVLQYIRTNLDFPFYITSGYRDKTHPAEIAKVTTGEHTKGLAVDINIHGERAWLLLNEAVSSGIPRIGVKQKGKMSGRFIHLGMGEKKDGFNSPWVWSY